jgi:hypothetical protein
VSEGDLVARKRLESLYRTLLTPVALVVTVSSVSYVNAATVFGIPEILGIYVVTTGAAVMFLFMSVLVYSAGHLDVKKCPKETYRAAFGLLVLSPCLSSSLLVAQFVSMVFVGDSSLTVVEIAFTTCLIVGIVSATWLARLVSKI